VVDFYDWLGKKIAGMPLAFQVFLTTAGAKRCRKGSKFLGFTDH